MRQQYNPDKKVIFHSYAKHRIKGAIWTACASSIGRRGPAPAHKQVEAATRDLSAKFGADADRAEIAEKMGVEVERWRQMVVRAANSRLDFGVRRGNERDNAAAPSSRKQEFNRQHCAKEELREMLMGAMKTLRSVTRRWSCCTTQRHDHEEIGGLLGINESRYRDPQDGAREDGDRAAVGGNSLERRV